MKAFRILLALLIAVALVYLRNRAHEERAASEADAPSVNASQESPVPEPAPTRSAASSVPVRESNQQELWQRFQKKFGTDLKAEFLSDGRVSSIRGKVGEGAPASREFRPADPQKAIARAREILADVRELLGIQEAAPLDNPIARGSLASAQVDFQEVMNGSPVAPFGGVSVRLGPQGELVGLDSSYVPNVKIQNEARLSADELRPKALVAAYASSVSAGDPVIWVTSSTASQPEGHHAYQYMAQGREVVVDASTGKVLFNRDRRRQ